MTRYNTPNLKLSNSQLKKNKIRNEKSTEVTLKNSPNIIGDSNDENNFPHKLLLTKTQGWRLRKAFANNSSANKKLSKIQLHKIGESRKFLGRLLGPLLKTGLLLMKTILKPFAKSVLISLGLTEAATDAAIHKKMFKSGMTTLIISIKEKNYTMKIVKSLEESGLLIKDVSETTKNKAKEQKGGFLGMLGTIITVEDTITTAQNF